MCMIAAALVGVLVTVVAQNVMNKRPSLSNSKCSAACLRKPRDVHTAKGGRVPQVPSSSLSTEDAAYSEDSPTHGHYVTASQSDSPTHGHNVTASPSPPRSPARETGNSSSARNSPRSPVRETGNSSSARNSPMTDSESAVGTGLSEGSPQHVPLLPSSGRASPMHVPTRATSPSASPSPLRTTDLSGVDGNTIFESWITAWSKPSSQSTSRRHRRHRRSRLPRW